MQLRYTSTTMHDTRANTSPLSSSRTLEAVPGLARYRHQHEPIAHQRTQVREPAKGPLAAKQRTEFS